MVWSENKEIKMQRVFKSVVYPNFDKSAYFSPDGAMGAEFGLNYDYVTCQEKNYTYGNDHIDGNIEQYQEIRRIIENLPGIRRKYELRAFCCVPSDNFGTSISFAIANRRTHKLRPASPFCVMYYGAPEFYTKNAKNLVSALVKYHEKDKTIGNQLSFSDYILGKRQR